MNLPWHLPNRKTTAATHPPLSPPHPPPPPPPSPPLAPPPTFSSPLPPNLLLFPAPLPLYFSSSPEPPSHLPPLPTPLPPISLLTFHRCLPPNSRSLPFPPAPSPPPSPQFTDSPPTLLSSPPCKPNPLPSPHSPAPPPPSLSFPPLTFIIYSPPPPLCSLTRAKRRPYPNSFLLPFSFSFLPLLPLTLLPLLSFIPFFLLHSTYFPLSFPLHHLSRPPPLSILHSCFPFFLSLLSLISSSLFHSLLPFMPSSLVLSLSLSFHSPILPFPPLLISLSFILFHFYPSLSLSPFPSLSHLPLLLFHSRFSHSLPSPSIYRIFSLCPLFHSLLPFFLLQYLPLLLSFIPSPFILSLSLSSPLLLFHIPSSHSSFPPPLIYSSLFHSLSSSSPSSRSLTSALFHSFSHSSFPKSLNPPLLSFIPSPFIFPSSLVNLLFSLSFPSPIHPFPPLSHPPLLSFIPFFSLIRLLFSSILLPLLYSSSPPPRDHAPRPLLNKIRHLIAFLTYFNITCFGVLS
ncbi:hypothetical protein C7M84_019922 [Penaeus vannamei]|uniref:Uncharacterized protein n=1 Tax=Penaeus vannamei TaxID=6689 RepID=A0A423U943_PENVA|nr:hypothetical protein C7M84_019922 [Penaeus vannamei]